MHYHLFVFTKILFVCVAGASPFDLVCWPQILELLWSMAHTPQLSPEMAEQALDAHCSILVDSTHSKDAERKVYIGKCVEDIKKVGVVAAQRWDDMVCDLLTCPTPSR